MALNEIVERIEGNLKNAYKKALEQNVKVWCVDELMNARQQNTELQNEFNYPADGNVYCTEKNLSSKKTHSKPLWAITRGNVNPILRNIDDAFEQLTSGKEYFVSKNDFAAAIDDPETVIVDMSKLRLQRKNDEYSYLLVDTSKKLADHNKEEQKVLKRIYGSTAKDFADKMNMMRNSQWNIKETRIWVLAPEYVIKTTAEHPVARASWLIDFSDDSVFIACYRDVDNYFGVRGVRRIVAEGDAKKMALVLEETNDISFERAYSRIIQASPQEMNDKHLLGLLKLAKKYVAAKQQ